jgi:hypothetical protein
MAQGQPDALNEGRRIYLGLAILTGRAAVHLKAI